MWWSWPLAAMSLVVLPVLGYAEDISVPLSIPIPPVVAEIELSYVGERTTPVVALVFILRLHESLHHARWHSVGSSMGQLVRR